LVRPISPGGEAMAIHFGVVEREGLPAKIVERVLTLIREKQLRPGDRLPPERELAAAMHVSRPSLREALHGLALMGVIENRQGSGTYVASLAPGQFFQRLDLVLVAGGFSPVDLSEALEYLEVELAGLAAERVTRRELSGLEACLNRAESRVGDAEAFLSLDLEAERRIVAAGKSKILGAFREGAAHVGLGARGRLNADPVVRRQSLRDHHRVLAALKRGDRGAARRAMAARHRHLAALQGGRRSLGPCASVA
jgi:GntR family transcriptional repressor for pyruvate dehydrogenase complex